MSRLRGGRPEGRGCQLASAVQVAGTYGGKGEYDSVHGLIAVEFPYRGPRRGGVDRHDRGSASGSRDWTRTSNLPVNSRLLCQLSYAGRCPTGPSETTSRPTRDLQVLNPAKPLR